MSASYHAVVLDNTIAPRTQSHPGAKPDQKSSAAAGRVRDGKPHMSDIIDPPAAEAGTDTGTKADTVQRLKPNAVGLIGVLFMAVATAAPITAMVGNVPIAVGFGNGAYAPAGYFVATIVLTLFAIGYAAMSKHITATGAFYGYISHGLGRIVGLGAGFLTTMAYMVFEASLIGIFAFFANDTFNSLFHINVSWIVFAIGMLVVNLVPTSTSTWPPRCWACS
jgi:hypothetical protein